MDKEEIEKIWQYDDQLLAEKLADINKWRRGEPPYAYDENTHPEDIKPMPYLPSEFGVMIDVAVNRLRTYGIIIKDLREQLEALKPKEFCSDNYE